MVSMGFFRRRACAPTYATRRGEAANRAVGDRSVPQSGELYRVADVDDAGLNYHGIEGEFAVESVKLEAVSLLLDEGCEKLVERFGDGWGDLALVDPLVECVPQILGLVTLLGTSRLDHLAQTLSEILTGLAEQFGVAFHLFKEHFEVIGSREPWDDLGRWRLGR